MAPTTTAAAKAAKAPEPTKAVKAGAPARSVKTVGAESGTPKKGSAKSSAPKVGSAAKKPAPKKAITNATSKDDSSKSSASRARVPALAKRSADGARKAPPKRKGPLDKFLLGQLALLEEERTTYTRQATSLKAEADQLMAEREPGDVQFDEESGEGDTIAVERERDLALSAQAAAAVEDIDRAIEKLHDGTYGVCEQCFSNIPKERLRALPYAALCVQCKSAGFSRR